MRRIILSLLLLSSLISFSQNNNQKIRIFLECTQGWLCDFDYVRNEIGVVDFVRDRFSSDVHILVNTQSSSSGGIQSQINFLGQNNFRNISDTITYFNDPTTTEDEQRKKLVQYLKIGLTRYLVKTDIADKITINYPAFSVSDTVNKPTVDKWKNWVFSISANGQLNGNQNSSSNDVYGSFSADRETEVWKINADVSINRSVYTYKENNKETKFERKNYYSNVQVAKALTPHWSWGLAASYENNLFSNLKASYKFRPKVEYSIFPYSKYNSQRIVFQYMVGPVYNNYYDTTAFLKTSEFQLQQSVNMITSFTKPWGSINMGIFYSNYFDDFGKNNLSFNGAVSWKVFKGFNFAIWGSYGLINDQISLRLKDASRDELLTNNRELKSSFRYDLGIGFSYRFGSILNSIVNPRFRGLSYSINL